MTVRLTGNTMGYTTVVLKKPDGSTLTRTATSGTNLNLTTQTLPMTGTYTVFIDPSGAAYRAVVDPSATTLGTVTVRVNTITDVTGSVTIGGSAVPVTITTAGRRALLTFSGTAGQQATVRVTGNKIGYTTVTLKVIAGSGIDAAYQTFVARNCK